MLYARNSKEREIEVMIAPVAVNGTYGIAPFYRISDTLQNLESLRAALSEFNGKHLLTVAELEENIEELRQKIREIVLPTLR